MVNFTADSQSKKARKSRERADLANAGELNRRYLTCQISAILYPDRGDWRISQSPHRAQLAIFADHRDRRIKSPGVSPALALLYVIASSVAKSLAKKFVFLVENQRQLCLQRNKNGSPKRSKGTSNEACAVILSLCLTGIISNKTVETFCVIILNYPTL